MEAARSPLMDSMKELNSCGLSAVELSVSNVGAMESAGWQRGKMSDFNSGRGDGGKVGASVVGEDVGVSVVGEDVGVSVVEVVVVVVVVVVAIVPHWAARLLLVVVVVMVVSSSEIKSL